MISARRLRRISIAEGCIACRLCEDLVPEAFEVPAGATSRVRNDWEARLAQDPEAAERVVGARDGCPVEVIRVELAAAPGEVRRHCA